MSKSANKYQSGFTVLELIVVAAIIGMVSSIVMANVTTAKRNTQDSQIFSQVQSIKDALLFYYEDNGRFPTDGVPDGEFVCLKASGSYCNYFLYPPSPSVVNALKPYMAKIPLPPLTANSGIDAYLYADRYDGSSCSSNCTWPTGTLLMWSLNRPLNTKLCPPPSLILDSYYCIDVVAPLTT